MIDTLTRINQTERAEAESMFLDCCGSIRWASRMTASRPFASDTEVMETAAAIWNDLETADWLEAFSAHPMIGESKAAPAQQAQSAKWSSGEQAGMNSADDTVRQDLWATNREYYDKFGFIYIVCATGKSAGEMLDLCRTRLANDCETEIMNAAREQQKITEIRLRKLLSQ